ncbi:MAG: hypothetical protein EPN69_11840 [Rhodanobacter sp.]|nr:MAG: hypothetical protein EPN71_15925 [Rhodanobacter sp.]TAL90701.1 MAG: hypothetical protein EPN69_11840 [Rhodanobacter sp.]TAM42081.1 MAG: hypothetical protein EPN58_04285 [Rhodanobacter sp.]
MKATPYFTNSVLARRPYITEAMCRDVIANAGRTEAQPDGRIRYYGYVESLGKWVRVVTLDDGETLHNAFADRGFAP